MANEPEAPPDPYSGIPADELPSQELERRALAYVNKVRGHYFLPALETLEPGRVEATTINPICNSIRHNSQTMRAQIIEGNLCVGESRKGIWQKEEEALPDDVAWFLKAHAAGAYPGLARSTPSA